MGGCAECRKQSYLADGEADQGIGSGSESSSEPDFEILSPSAVRLLPAIDAPRLDPGCAHSVESLAQTVHFSPFHFHRRFSEEFGQTVSEYQRQTRLAWAARLLLSDAQITLSTASTRSGFEYLSSFSRSFKQYFGSSPSDWIAGARRRDERLFAVERGPRLVPGRNLRFVNLDSSLVASVAVRGDPTLKAIRRSCRLLSDWLAQHRFPMGALRILLWGDTRIAGCGSDLFEVSCQIPSRPGGCHPVHIRSMPAATYVNCDDEVDLADGLRILEALNRHWLPRAARCFASPLPNVLSVRYSCTPGCPDSRLKLKAGMPVSTGGTP